MVSIPIKDNFDNNIAIKKDVETDNRNIFIKDHKTKTSIFYRVLNPNYLIFDDECFKSILINFSGKEVKII